MELVRKFTQAEYEGALSSWTWLPIEAKTPLFTNAFGDTFLAGDEGIYFLDTIDGTLDRLCESIAELQAILNTRDGQERYLWSIVVSTNYAAGIVPWGSQVYDFEIMPVLGGELDPDNIKLCDYQVAVNLAGQIHGQVKDLPPGTPIGEIKME